MILKPLNYNQQLHSYRTPIEKKNSRPRVGIQHHYDLGQNCTEIKAILHKDVFAYKRSEMNGRLQSLKFKFCLLKYLREEILFEAERFSLSLTFQYISENLLNQNSVKLKRFFHL